MQLKNIYFLRIAYQKLRLFLIRIKTNGLFPQLLFNGIKVHSNGCYKLSKDILGLNNVIRIGKNSFIKSATVRIHGNNNQLIIDDNVIIGPNCSFWMEGNNCRIHIGSKTTVTRDVQLNCQENNMEISLGQDCMLSNSIIIRTSDSHPIYDRDTGNRINLPKSISIGNHVWIAPNTKIMKGSIIEDGCIIGSDTTVNSTIPYQSLAVGRPCRVVKNGVRWTRENLF